VQTVPLDADAAATAVQAWRTANPPVTAICAFNDNTALAVIAGLRHVGLTAPTDLAVIGIDDTPPPTWQPHP
jgi:DNA-binding LacI/PurR family transcriptional regulator